MGLKARTGFAAAALLGIAGCMGVPDAETTDAYAQRLLQDTENDQSLVDTYNVMVDDEQSHLGVIFVLNVEDVDRANATCMDYKVFTSNNSALSKLQSNKRRACLPQ